MGTYGSPLFGRAAVTGIVALSSVWNLYVVASLLAGAGTFPVGFAAFSVGTHLWNSYWFMHRIAARVTVRPGVLEWQAPTRTVAVAVADITAIRAVRVLPSLISVRRRAGGSLVILAGKGVSDLAAAVARERPGLDRALGPWTALVERLPGPSLWRPTPRHLARTTPQSY